jgi:hypothetical protein
MHQILNLQRKHGWAVVTLSVTEVTEPMRKVLLGPIQYNLTDTESSRTVCSSLSMLMEGEVI